MLDKAPTPPATLQMARRIGRERGLRYVYTGNIHDPAGQTTYCHGCGTALIKRDWYDLIGWQLTADGRCASCDAACPGVFEARPGRWGRRRAPMRISAEAWT
jgi:pyruvate formate lyase activating enzyme